MTDSSASISRDNLIGGLWMVLSMAAFAIEDSLIKILARDLPVGQIMILFGCGGALCFAVITKLNKQAILTRDVLSKSMVLRMVFEVIGRLFFILAIVMIPLSQATVILQATPLVVVLAAVVLFGEKVTLGRWIAILIGLSGVVLIIEPGTSDFSVLSLLAVVGMLGLAGRDLASRVAPLSIGTSQLGFYGFVSVVLAGVIFALWQGTPFARPDFENSATLFAAILAGIAAYACLMKAMRTGEVSAVTPLRYTRILFGVGIGVLFFDEQLTYTLVLGSGLILVSGLYLALVQRKRWRSSLVK